MPRFLALMLGLACALAPGAARGEPAEPDVAVYALVVGSNAGGAGQAALRYAEDDARRVAVTLVELGGYPADAIDVVAHPTPAALRDHLDQLAARVAAARAAGRQARVVFYYSGHARATALDLGAEELALGELRQRLFGIPATLTVVVLDACQSGAFSRIKGAEPAADFSFNSRQHLDASGIAVLASSSGSELSQESEQLHSSYFTHHLLVGLRGAGDADGDGQVSIDEAYRYAYHQTLLATAGTAVGGQHVSLEVDLKGHGDVPLTFPRAATAAIVLPAGLEGQTLVEDRRAHAVVAETYKARGQAVRIAVAPGDYRVLVRQGGVMARCDLSIPRGALPPAPPAEPAGSPPPSSSLRSSIPRGALPTGGAVTVELDRCAREPIAIAASKGGDAPGRRLRFELDGIAGGERKDGFTSTLGVFGYHQSGGLSAGLALSVTRQLERRLWIGGFGALVGSPEWTLPTERQPLRFSWTTAALGPLVRAIQPLGDHGLAARAGLYAQLGAGLGLGSTRLTDQDGKRTDQQFAGWATTMGAGLRYDGARFGGSLGYQFDYAPVIDNLAGDTHASGGHRLSVGVSYAY